MRTSRAAHVYNAAGEEVLITYPCFRCGRVKPLGSFGLRRMGNGQIRSISWCKTCRALTSWARSTICTPKRLSRLKIASPETIARAQKRLAARGIKAEP